MKMKQALLFVFAFVLSGRSIVLAQAVEETPKPFMAEHARALLFGLDKDLYLDSFIGTTISAKKHVSAKTAFRGGLSLRASVAEQTYEDPYYNNESKYRNAQYFFAVHVDYLRFFQASSRLYFFSALGPSISFSKWNRQHWSGDLEDMDLRSESESNEWSAGAYGAVGVEWFVARNISLTAEYGVTMNYSLEKTKSIRKGEVDRKSESEETGFTIQPNTKKLGISLYF